MPDKKCVFFSLTERLPSPATLLLIQNITYCFLATNKQPYQSEIGRFLDEAFRPLQSPLNPQKNFPHHVPRPPWMPWSVDAGEKIKEEVPSRQVGVDQRTHLLAI